MLRVSPSHNSAEPARSGPTLPIVVSDHDRALTFYTEVSGFQKRAPYGVAAPFTDPDGNHFAVLRRKQAAPAE